jgi:hypothetical protein
VKAFTNAEKPLGHAEWDRAAEHRTEDCAGDVIMGLVREPSYFRAFPQALSRVHEHNFAAS